MWDAHENNECWVIEMREHECRFPEELSGYEDVVFDGFCKTVEMLQICRKSLFRHFRKEEMM